jgi:hypothetical protein
MDPNNEAPNGVPVRPDQLTHGGGQLPVLSKKPANKKRIITVGVVAVIVAVLAVLLFLIMSGRIYIGAKNPSQKVVVQTVVCGDDIINRYNPLEDPLYDGQDSLEAISNDIKKLKNYSDDPTCQQILFYDAIRRENVSDMETAKNAIKNLHEHGVFVDNNLTYIQSIPTMEQVIEANKKELGE